MKYKIEDIEINLSKNICDCGKTIGEYEPCGILISGKKICMYCARETLKENNYNAKVLLGKLEAIYINNLKKIILNKL
jgi:hypothetical protein